MTNFSNPYAPIPGDMMMEQRTSVLAIIALVCSLVCFLPLIPALGVLLAVIALVMISSSNGRLGGRGLAIAALVLGLVFSALQIGAIVAVSKGFGMFGSMFAQPVGALVKAIDTQDFTTARTSMVKGAGERLTDADFEKFRTGYQAELGAFKGMATSMGQMWSGYQKVAPLMQGYQNGGGQNPVIPLPAEFEKGWALVVVQMDKNQQPQNSAIQPANIIIHAASGTKWTLYEGPMSGAGAGTGTAPGDASGTDSTTIPGPDGTETKIEPAKQPDLKVEVKTNKPTDRPVEKPADVPAGPK